MYQWVVYILCYNLFSGGRRPANLQVCQDGSGSPHCPRLEEPRRPRHDMLQARLSRVQVVGTPGKAFDNNNKKPSQLFGGLVFIRSVLYLGLELRLLPSNLVVQLVSLYSLLFQNKVESFIMQTERRLFNNFHRQVFCWTGEFKFYNSRVPRTLGLRVNRNWMGTGLTTLPKYPENQNMCNVLKLNASATTFCRLYGLQVKNWTSYFTSNRSKLN